MLPELTPKAQAPSADNPLSFSVAGVTVRWIWLIGLGSWAQLGQAITYSNFIEDGGWRTESSNLSCSMTHAIPYYGRAVFTRDAGEPLHFALRPLTPTLKSGQALLIAQPPVWKSTGSRRELGYVAVGQGVDEVGLGASRAEQMLTELLEGQEIQFTRKLKFGSEDPAQVAITTIGFRAAYRDYETCLASLLPVNFEQIQRTSVYFGSNQHEKLQPLEQQKLDNILAYIKADPQVKEFYIDGHTDAMGSEADNVKLAEKRAVLISNYLVKGGVPKEALWVRWHGERYPVASNDDRLGLAKNRRVTIRLETEATGKLQQPQDQTPTDGKDSTPGVANPMPVPTPPASAATSKAPVPTL